MGSGSVWPFDRGLPMRGFLVTTLLLGLAVSPALAAQPHLANSDLYVWLTGLPNVLDEAEIDQELHSGLTNSWTFQLVHQRTVAGSATVAIRWDLWDEQYVVQIEDLSGSQEMKIDSDEIGRWWDGLRLAVRPMNATYEASSVRVRISFAPFSQEEENGKRGTGSRPPAKNNSLTRSVSNGLLGALVVTSVRRTAIWERSWEVPWP